MLVVDVRKLNCYDSNTKLPTCCRNNDPMWDPTCWDDNLMSPYYNNHVAWFTLNRGTDLI
jgi:hypothetical protein